MSAVSPRFPRFLTGMALLLDAAALFALPGLVLMGGFAPLAGLTPYENPLELPLRVLAVFALSWRWIWTQGTAFQILLTLLLAFCGVWAAVLLRRVRRTFTRRESCL